MSWQNVNLLDPEARIPDATRLRRFARTVIVLALLEMTVIVGANVIINPRADFPGQRFEPVIPDFPLGKIQAYDKLDEPVDTLILGSSRALTMDPDHAEAAGWPRAFNFAFPSGGFELAHLAIQYVDRHQERPAVILQSLDAMDLAIPDVDAQHATSALPILAGEGIAPSAYAHAALTSLSPKYLRDSASVLYFTYVAGYPEKRIELEPDGLGRFARMERALAEGREDRDAVVAAHYERSVSDLYSHLNQLRPDKQAALRAYVEDVTATSELHFFMGVIHPDIMARLDNDHPFWRDAHEEILADLIPFCGPRLHLHDLTDPARSGVVEEDFVDAWHITAEATGKVVRAMAAGEYDRCADAAS